MSTRGSPVSWLTGLMVAVLMAVFPSSVRAQELPPIGIQIPVNPNPCSSCLTSTTGTTIVHFRWTPSKPESSIEALPPAGALVRGVYVDSISGSGVTLSKVELTYVGWKDVIIEPSRNGSGFSCPTYQLPKTLWNGLSVTEGEWVVLPTVIGYSSSSELKVDLGIKWEVPNTPPPPPPPAQVVGEFESMGLTFSIQSYAYDPSNQSRTVQGRVVWSPPFADGVSENPISFWHARPSLNERLGIQGNHAYDFNALFMGDVGDAPMADGVTRSFRMYAKASDGKEVLLPGSPKTRCYLPNADRTNVGPCDGTLLRRPDGRLYVIAGGAPFLFANDAEAQSLGYDLSKVQRDNEGFYALAANWRLRDGTLVRFGGSAAHYVAAGGGLFWAPDPTSLNSYLSAVGKTSANVMFLPRAYMPKSTPAPTVGVAVNEVGKTAIWVYQGGGRFWAPSSESWAAYGQATGMTDVKPLPAGSLSSVIVDVNGVDQVQARDDLSPRDGTAVHEVGKTAIWVYQGGGRFWAPSSESWAAYGQATGVTSVKSLPSGSLSNILVEVNGGAQVQARDDLSPRDGTAVHEVGKTAIWVYQGGGRFWAPSSESWAAYGQATGVTSVKSIPFGSLLALLVDASDGSQQYKLREDTKPRDGTLVREVNNPGIFVYQGGGNFVFPDPTEFNLWPAPRPVLLLPDGSLSALLVSDTNNQDALQVRDDLPADGTLLRERTGTQVYQVQGQRKYPATGYDPEQVKLVPNGSIQRVPNG
ncbi:hypothetical protein [Cystobacter fuscus]|uniref:hypothetical protein n=1 Tax=Cystobacter fuscus TaxID=43 RepID=UPI002B2B2FE6|nr:hypothetical protein F0U63_05120 [Cystobacter fuscus]